MRSHKNNHNFDDTPSSACFCETGAEDTYHYLFRCPLYAGHRTTLATKVISILLRNNLNHLGNTVSVYLYGHHSLSDSDNRSIILATLEFLKNTNRFTQEPYKCTTHSHTHTLTYMICCSMVISPFYVFVCLVLKKKFILLICILL